MEECIDRSKLREWEFGVRGEGTSAEGKPEVFVKSFILGISLLYLSPSSASDQLCANDKFLNPTS